MEDSFSYLTLAHGLAIGASLMLALTHVVLILRSRFVYQQKAFAASTVMAISAAGAIYFELRRSLAGDIDAYLAALLGDIISSVFMVVALLIFVRHYLQARANLLFFAAIACWVIGTGHTVMFYPDGFYSEVGELIRFETRWGEPYAKIDATVSPFKYVFDLGTVLVIAYISLTSIETWKRGTRRRPLVVGGASVGFLLVAGILVPLDDAGVLRNTMPIGLPFLGIIGVLTYQLIDDRERTSRLRVEVEQLRRSSLAGEIAAGLVHELSQPLTSVLGNAQAARRFLDADEPDLGEVRDALDDVIGEDKRAAGIISGLRSFLHDQPVETSVIDANAPIRRVRNMLATDFLRNGTTLELYLHPHPVAVVAGEVQLEQVLMNLSLNALRALRETPESQRRVRIQSQPLADTVEIRVADSGPGIEPELASQIFEPFITGKDGLGMGLAICRRIVEGHGGTIRVGDSELGGAEFVVNLPRARNSKR